MIKRQHKTVRMTASELEAASRDFDRPDYSPRFATAPAAEQHRHDRAIRGAKRKRGRPTIGQGAQRIQVTVERKLLSEADRYARHERISRSQLITRGLKMALAS